MPKRCPSDQRERATRMALDRLGEYGSASAVAQALGPKLGVGPETLRNGCCCTCSRATSAHSCDSSAAPAPGTKPP
jgi:hypothetical protein